MRSLLFILLIGAWGLAAAQLPPDPEPADGNQPPASGEPAGSPEETMGGRTAAGEETPVEAEPDVDGGETAGEEPVEATPEEVFKPGDEISEDYPIPLPSDI